MTEPDAGQRRPAPVVLPRTEVRTIQSEHGPYRVSVAYPADPAPPSGFPVLYVLDGDRIFGTVVETVRLRGTRTDVTGIPPVVVAGIDHGGEGTDLGERRLRDYTTPRAVSADGGGAERFQAFLIDRVKPEIERDFPLDRRHQSILGHSLAGYFVLHMLVTRPEEFRSYVAVSPSIWWDPRHLMSGVDALDRSPSRGGERRVFVGVGELEQKLAPGEMGTPGAEVKAERRRARAMVDSARELSARLSGLGHPDLRVHFEEFAGEDHASALLRGIGRGLPHALAASSWIPSVPV